MQQTIPDEVPRLSDLRFELLPSDGNGLRQRLRIVISANDNVDVWQPCRELFRLADTKVLVCAGLKWEGVGEFLRC